MVGMVNKSSTNLYALLASLLQWAQIQTGNMKYDPEKIDICNCCKTVSEQLKTFAENKKIDLVNSIEDGTLALADEKATLTILRNLVSNAIKYSHPGGIVTIGSKRNEKTIEISVADNGIGMDKSTLNKLFELTEKVSQTGTAQETGTGLGLILCKELIEKQNGKIWAKSTPGEGSIFRFTLPVSQN
jgi:signal transduction histidine kinase